MHFYSKRKKGYQSVSKRKFMTHVIHRDRFLARLFPDELIQIIYDYENTTFHNTDKCGKKTKTGKICRQRRATLEFELECCRHHTKQCY